MRHTRFFYRFDGDFYQFIEAEIERGKDKPVREKIRGQWRQVAICFDSDDSVLLKHGNVEWVREKATEIRSRLRDGALSDMAESIQVLEFPIGFDVEEINKCIEITGYIGVLLKKFDEVS